MQKVLFLKTSFLACNTTLAPSTCNACYKNAASRAEKRITKALEKVGGAEIRDVWSVGYEREGVKKVKILAMEWECSGVILDQFTRTKLFSSH